MRRPTTKELVLAGVGAVLTGILLEIGAKIADTLLGLTSASFLIPSSAILTAGIAILLIVGLLVASIGIYYLRKTAQVSSGPFNPSATPTPASSVQIYREGDFIVDPVTNRKTLKIKKAGRNYAMLIDSTHTLVGGGGCRATVIVTPRTLYRFALGVWTSINPLTWENRLGILEVDDLGFLLTYTEYDPNSGIPLRNAHTEFNIARPRADDTYAIELQIEANGAIHGKVFDSSKRLLGEARHDSRFVPKYRFDDAFVGVAVWTDQVSCPPSTYEIDNFDVS